VVDVIDPFGSRQSEPDPARPPLRGRILLLIALIVLIVFGRSIVFDFVDYDDPRNIFQNPLYLPVNLTNIAHFWHAPYSDQYMPVTWSIWGILAHLGALAVPTHRLGGPDTLISPLPFHLVAVGLHVANALLVYALLLRLIRREVPALFGALLFAIHPFQTECVGWVNGSNISLAYLFGVGALYLYLEAADADTAPWQRRWLYPVASLLFLGAMLAKPSAIALVGVAFVLDALVLQRPLRRIAPQLLLWFLIAAAVDVYNWIGSRGSQTVQVALWSRPFVAGDALAFYLGRILLPLRLCLDYGRSPGVVLANTWGYITWLAPAMVAVILYRLRQRWLWTAGAVFLAALLPVLGLVPFYYQHYSTVADRYMYLAMLGPAIAFAWMLTTRFGESRIGRLSAIGYLLGLGLLSAAQISFWQNDLRLFEHVAEVNSESAMANYSLGNTYSRLDRMDEALAYFEHANRIAPGFVDNYALVNWGNALAGKGRLQEARQRYEEALRREPGHADALVARGLLNAQEGHTPAAIADWQQALVARPQDVGVEYNLTLALIQLNRRTEALSHLQSIVTRRPDFAPAQQLLARIMGSAQ